MIKRNIVYIGMETSVKDNAMSTNIDLTPKPALMTITDKPQNPSCNYAGGDTMLSLESGDTTREITWT